MNIYERPSRPGRGGWNLCFPPSLSRFHLFLVFFPTRYIPSSFRLVVLNPILGFRLAIRLSISLLITSLPRCILMLLHNRYKIIVSLL